MLWSAEANSPTNFMLKDVRPAFPGLTFKFSFALAIYLDSILQFSAKANVAARIFHKVSSWVLFPGLVFLSVLKSINLSLLF